MFEVEIMNAGGRLSSRNYLDKMGYKLICIFLGISSCTCSKEGASDYFKIAAKLYLYFGLIMDA